jgi:hypothetical protein
MLQQRHDDLVRILECHYDAEEARLGRAIEEVKQRIGEAPGCGGRN